MTLERELTEERREAEESLESERERARGEVRRESETSRWRLNRRRGNLLEQTQQAKSQVRRAESLEQRKADLPMTKPRDIGAKEALEDIARQSKGIEKEITALERQINTAEAEALADIERQVTEKRAELDRLYQEGLSEIRTWEAGHIQVKDDWITKEDWDKLDKRSQSKLKELGIEGYNTWVKSEAERYEKEYKEAVKEAERKEAEWKRNHIKLNHKDPDTGDYEWVSKEEWDKLSLQEQHQLSNLGVVAFNNYQKTLGAMRHSINVINRIQEADFYAKHIQVGDDWILKSDYDKLTPKQQVIIKEAGIDNFNNWNAADYRIQQWGEIYANDDEAFRRALAIAIGQGDIKDVSIATGHGASGKMEANIKGKPRAFFNSKEIKEYWNHLTNQEKGILWNNFKPTATVGESWIQASEMFIPGVAVARNWDEMSNEERGLHIALDALIVGSLFAKPVIGAVRNVVVDGLGSARTSVITKALGNLRKAVNKGDAVAIRTASKDLRAIGSRLRNEKVTGSDELLRQADWFDRNADMLAKEGLKVTPDITAKLKNATDTLKGFIEPKARPGAVGFSKEAAERIRELKPKVAPKETKVHPLTREEFNRYTKDLTTEQRARIANTSAETRERVIKEIREMRQSNANRDAMWREIERQLEKAREGKGYSIPPVRTTSEESLVLVKPRPQIFTASQLRERAEGLAKAWFKAKGTKYDLNKSKLQIRNVAKQRLNELLKEYAKGGQNSAIAINQILAEGLLANLVASAPKTAFQILREAKPSEKTKALNLLSTDLKEAIQTALATSTAQSIAKAQTLAKAWVKGKTLLKSMIELEPELEYKVELDPKLDINTKTTLKTMIRTIKPYEPIPRKIPKEEELARRRRIRIKPHIELPGGKKLTKEELEASVAWKQGFIYKLIYPPYGKKNIINTREPIPGVKYHTGPESAYRSLTQIKKGELPPIIRRDMGIMDIEITAGHTTLGGRKTKPKIKFRQDKRQATKTTPIVGGVR